MNPHGWAALAAVVTAIGAVALAGLIVCASVLAVRAVDALFGGRR